MRQLLLRDTGHSGSTAIGEYLRIGGYSALRKAIEMSPAEVVEEVTESNLLGRGGAGFPTGRKWEFAVSAQGSPKYLICNADEGEPGTFKDRVLMEKNPHLLIEGMAIASHALGAKKGYIYLRHEYPTAGERLEQAINEAHEHGFLGNAVGGSSLSFDVEVFRGAGAYICGEETALLESLEGKPGRPRFKPPFPAGFGVYGQPTTINNTQSYASVPQIIRKGPGWFADLGVEGSGGTLIFSVSGHVNKPGNFELPLGIPFRELLDLAGGVRDGRRLKAVIPGGCSVPVMPAANIMDITMDYNSVQQAGSALGTGAMIVMDDTTCMVRALRRISRFYHAESCGQCTPCREGTGWLHRMLTRIIDGQGTTNDLDLLLSVANKIEGHTICAFGDAAAWPVQSFLKHFFHEFEYMIEHGGRSIVDDQPEAA